jgi:S-DNA-T family DNA segregation ATPase FtsK/SpoIIIE
MIEAPARNPFERIRRLMGRSPVVRNASILLLGALAGAAAWQSDIIWRNVGYGLAILVPAGSLVLGTLLFRPRLLRRQWYRLLGLLSFGALAWGCLGFYDAGNGALSSASLGGYLSQDIIGSADSSGVARLAGMGGTGVLLIGPQLILGILIGAGVAIWRSLALVTRSLNASGVWARDSLVAGAVAVREGMKDLWTHRPKRVPRPSLAPGRVASVDNESTPPWIEQQEAVEPTVLDEEDTEAEWVPVEATLISDDTFVDEDETDEEVEQEAEVDEEVEEDSALDDVMVEEPEPQPVAAVPTREDWSEEPSATSVPEPVVSDGWTLPSLELLDNTPVGTPSTADNESRARAIEAALASYGIDAKVVEINPGPAVTQFGIEPGWTRRFKEIRVRDGNGKPVVDENGKPVVRREEVSRTRVKVDAITNLDKDIALALAASSIRIEAPVPGKSMVGIEVPNNESEIVGLRTILESGTFAKSLAKSKLAIALGKGSGGDSEVADLAKMPHVLIAGATGAGKSVCINVFLTCLLMHSTPRELRLLLVDPKRVELVPFNSVPHLITPVITDVDQVVGALKWAMHEMDERYKKFSAVGARNLDAYNKSPKVAEPLPCLVIAVDELADLMMAAPYDVEHGLTRLAQLGRATGIHLIVATQRPSVDVVTGLIKANFPTRISFAVGSMVDSRTILDTGGAEKLLGKGDMLFLPQDAPKPKRIQGVYLSDREIERVIMAWNSQVNQPRPPRVELKREEERPVPTEATVTLDRPMSQQALAKTVPPTDDADPLMEQARELADEHPNLSPSLLSRKLRIGQRKAKLLLDMLEEEGLVDTGQEVAP